MGYTVKVARFLKSPAPDLLFLGSSRIRLGVNSEIFAGQLSNHLGRPVKVFNLGLDGAMAEEIHTVAHSYLRPPLPRYVVVGFSGTTVTLPHTFMYAARYLWGTSDFFDFLRRTPLSKVRMEHVEHFLESLAGRAWYLFEHRGEFSEMIMGSLRRLAKIPEDENLLEIRRKELARMAHVLAPDGFSPAPEKFYNLQDQINLAPETIRVTQRFLNRDPGLFDKPSADLQRRILRRLKELGCEVAVVETPVSPYLQDLNPVLNGKNFRQWMAELAEEEGVLFLSFPYEETGINNTFYEDYSHLNPAGAARYTHILFRKLRDAGFFAETRE